MEYVILGLLSLKPMTIYEINSSFKQGISLFYSASYGSIQSALKKITRNLWAEVSDTIENGRKKKFYSVSAAGRSAFFEWMESAPEMKKLEVSVLSRLFFLGLIETPTKRKTILDTIITAINNAYEELGQYHDRVSGMIESIDEESKTIAAYQVNTLEYGIISHRAALDFFKKLAENESRQFDD